MVMCWLSDTTVPVATEISLDAVEKNDNQFSGSVYTDGEWTRVDETGDGSGFMRDRVLNSQGDYHFIEFQSNGGGTLTVSTRVGFLLLYRDIGVNGEELRLRLLRVESVEY